MNNPEFELLVYLITSARALPEEPASYGSIRLTEAASRLCQIMVNFLTVLKLIREKP